MAPGSKKKHVNLQPHRNNYVHPSLRSSTQDTGAEGAPAKEQSVNERLTFLRREQAGYPINREQESSNVQDMSSLPSRGSRRPPRVAGPKPPKSWTEGSYKLNSAGRYTFQRQVSTLDSLPGIEFPPHDSLLHQCLKSLAVDFEWHVEYDHVYLAALPIRCKNLLLSYIARYGPEEGVSIHELLHLLYSQQELEACLPMELASTVQATGCEDLERLDLAGSIGRRMPLKQLERNWIVRSSAATLSTPETWDNVEDKHQLELPLSLPGGLRLPSLTKLSLGHPGRGVTWPELLSFSKHLTALTHLSLDNWPVPSTSTSTVSDQVSARGYQYVASKPNPSIQPRRVPTNEDYGLNLETLDDASHALQLLSRNTPSLTYLSLVGCQSWFRALMHITSPTASGAEHQHQRHPLRHSSVQRAGWRDMLEFGASQHNSNASGTDKTACNSPCGVNWVSNWRHLTKLDLSQLKFPAHDDLTTTINPEDFFRLFRARSDNVIQTTDLEGCDWSTTCTDLSHIASYVARTIHDHLRTHRPNSSMNPYVVYSSNRNTVDRIKNRAETAAWVHFEVDALDIGLFIRTIREHDGKGRGKGRGKPIEIVHGWGKQDLLCAGYSELELFDAGF